MRAKKLIILYAVVLFLVVFAVTFNCVCSIARFDVTFEVSSMGQQAKAVQEKLEKEYGGKSYLFFSEEDVQNVVLELGGGYLEVENFSKTFPNVIHAEVREKYEELSLKLGDKYYAVDKENTVLAVNDTAVNNVAGSNVAVYGIAFAVPEVGDTLTVAAEDEAAFAAVRSAYKKMDEILGGARVNVSAMRFSREFEGLEYGGTDLYIEMREGVCVWIPDPLENAEDKIGKAMDMYLSLSDAQRMYGYIAFTGDAADYNAEKPPFTVEEA